MGLANFNKIFYPSLVPCLSVYAQNRLQILYLNIAYPNRVLYQINSFDTTGILKKCWDVLKNKRTSTLFGQDLIFVFNRLQYAE